jgi:RecA-family ATPase
LLLPPPRVHQPSDYRYTAGENEPYIERAVEDECRKLATTGQGGRGYQLNASAFSLGTLVASGALSRQEAESKLYDAAVACGVVQKDGERETWAKIRRGLSAGELQPRQIPAANEKDNTRLVDVKRMIANGLKKASREELLTATDSYSAEQEPPSDEPPTEAQPEPSPEAFYITPYEYKNPASLERREFAFGTHYIRKYVSVTVSPGGLGKTSNSIVEALAMCSGRALTGIKPPQRMKVWLFNAEDPRDEMERRIQAACLHYKLGPDDINGWLFLDTGREQELVVAHEDRKAGVRYNAPVIEAVIENIRRYGIDVMTVDPFVSTHSVNENDNGAIDKVAKLWAHIADETNTSIDVVHHLRKVSDREATVEDARGAVALIGAARSVRVLNRMSEDQATAAGIPPADRFSYFNIHQGKANLTRMSSAQDWRKLESVALGNGRGLQKPQDHAGVVTEWKWPGSEEIAEGITQEQRGRIASLLAGQAYKLAKQAKEAWAGVAVMAAMDLDIDDKASVHVATSALKALLKEGFLTVEERRDERSRTIQKFVVAA